MGRNLHLFLENIKPITKTKNCNLWKNVLKMWSLIGKIWLNMSIILVLLSLRNNIFRFFDVFVFWTFFSKSCYGPIQPFFDRSETTIAKQFFLDFNYCFLFLVWYCLKTCVNRVANCVTQKFTPLRSEFWKQAFLWFMEIVWKSL